MRLEGLQGALGGPFSRAGRLGAPGLARDSGFMLVGISQSCFSEREKEMFVQPLKKPNFFLFCFVLENVSCLVSDTGNSLSMEERGIPLGLLLIPLPVPQGGE